MLFCSSHQAGSNNIHDDLEKFIRNLTSGQGHVMVQEGHVAYQSMRLDETDTFIQFPRL